MPENQRENDEVEWVVATSDSNIDFELRLDGTLVILDDIIQLEDGKNVRLIVDQLEI